MPDSPVPPRPAAMPDSSGAGQDSAVTLLDIHVAAGDAGPVVMLSGEADVTTLGQLEDVLNAQLAAGARTLTVDLSELRFADSATIGALVRAARTLKAGGGRLDLTNPQPALAQMLALLGVDEVLTVRDDETGSKPGTSWPR
jgi:anti-anti-sigma factor